MNERAYRPDGINDLPWDRIRMSAPGDLEDAVRRRITGRDRPRARRWRWTLPPAHPILAAAAALTVAAAVWVVSNREDRAAVPSVVFQFHAPDAEAVEVLGSFNGWKPGTMVMEGPDAAGYWHTRAEIPAGRHEYVFLMNGRQWVEDPSATIQRPDGFGRVNSVLEM